MRTKGMLALALAGALLAAGCRYTTTGGLPPEIKTIGVTVLRNNTRYPGLEGEVTAAVIAALQSYGRLAVTDAGKQPDLVLTGTVDGYRRSAIRADRFGDPVRFTIEIEATVTVRQASGGHLLRKSHVSSAGNDPESGAVDLTRGESEARGRAAAVTELGRNIARRILEQGW
jgi:hypothetical protein